MTKPFCFICSPPRPKHLLYYFIYLYSFTVGLICRPANNTGLKRSNSSYFSKSTEEKQLAWQGIEQKFCPPNRRDDLCLCFSLHPSSMPLAICRDRKFHLISLYLDILRLRLEDNFRYDYFSWVKIEYLDNKSLTLLNYFILLCLDISSCLLICHSFLLTVCTST